MFEKDKRINSSDTVSNAKQSSSTRSIFVHPGMNNFSVTGYSDLYVRPNMDNQKIMLYQSHPELGLYANVVYIVDYCEASYVVTIPQNSLFIAATSPECGYSPAESNVQGYSSTQLSNGSFNMTTRCVHYKYIAGTGQQVNVYAPKHPSTFKWNYNVYCM